MTVTPQSPILHWFSDPWLGIIGVSVGALGVLVAIIIYLTVKKERGALKSDGGTWLFAFVLGIATVAVVVLEIESLNTQGTGTTQSINSTEVALFSILQFVLSIGFAWILSRASFRREFAEGQKAFATAAYRRTREIEVATKGLIARTSGPKPGGSPDLIHELEVVLAIARGIQQAVRFSIADWADVIGDEIAAIEQIEELTKEEQTLRKSPSQDGDISSVPAPAASSEVANQLLGVEGQIERLRASLPPGLRMLAQKGPAYEDPGLSACQRQLANAIKETGVIRLSGFWEENAGFGRSIKEFAEGADLRVEINDAGTRAG